MSKDTELSSIQKLKLLTEEMQIAWETFLEEKTLELEERRRTSAIPNYNWFNSHPQDLDNYLDRVRFPSDREKREAFRDYVRGLFTKGPRISCEPEILDELFIIQNKRCNACGKTLTREPKNYEADHINPYASSPREERSNFQLLCESCNAGKSDAINYSALAAWRISNSDLRSDEKMRGNWLSVRYAVLARDGFKCRLCGKSNWLTSSLYVKMRIPWKEGGQLILDNLCTVCEFCAEEEEDNGGQL